MKASMAAELAESVIDALTSSICVVDLDGTILAVNRAWMEFGSDNAGGAQTNYLGLNYLNICRPSTGSATREAVEFFAGLHEVLQGRSQLFQMEYACHSPTELRWFVARVTPLVKRDRSADGTLYGAVVSHMNITDRKLLELEYARLASTDALTNLPNRRFFGEYSKIEFARSRQFGAAISVLVLDLDHFKLVNDRYGHLVGDEVLRKVAARCQALLREGDLIARVGGEEFVALLAGTDEAAAMLVAERLRSGIADMKIATAAGTVRVTTSIGVSRVSPRDRSITAAIHRADEAVYAAKHLGRNRVIVAAVRA